MSKNLKIKVYNLDNKEIEDIQLSKEVFGQEVKKEVVAKLVNWQLAKKRKGNHKVKERNEIVGSNAKIYKQKGTGRARHGSKKVVQFKGGGVVHGPRKRSHEYKIPAKVKKLAMKMILSDKLKEGNLRIVDKLEVKSCKTKDMVKKIEKLGLLSVTFLDAVELNKNFLLSTRNIKNIDVLIFDGINAVQILKRDILVISKNALDKVEKHYT
tara:strand:- start:207 stop:839 length:633 start_codon:yes stop_codon:yes gene_type:complete